MVTKAMSRHIFQRNEWDKLANFLSYTQDSSTENGWSNRETDKIDTKEWCLYQRMTREQKKNLKQKTIVFDTSKTKNREILYIRTRKQMKPYYVNEQKEIYYIWHEFSKFINVLITRVSK